MFKLLNYETETVLVFLPHSRIKNPLNQGCVCVCGCVLPNKDLTSVRTAPANPAKTDGKKWAIFVPQLSHVLIVQRTTRILSVSCYCITQSNSHRGQLAQGRLPRGVHPEQTPPCETLKVLEHLMWRMEQERRQTWKRQRLYITRGKKLLVRA